MSSAATDSASLSSALGCLLGAFVGDSAGSLLEFQNAPSAADVDRAMEMPGGGVHRVLPGQVTDDGELTLSLAHALLEANSVADNAPVQRVSSEYCCALVRSLDAVGPVRRWEHVQNCNVSRNWRYGRRRRH